MRPTPSSPPEPRWQLPAGAIVPAPYLERVRACGAVEGQLLSQLLWQRGIAEADLAGFLKPECYQPTAPQAFGPEMDWAIARLLQAQIQGEQVAIWGDFDADGVTATAVLWEGLRPFFLAPDQLRIHIPNRLRESHGLHGPGLQALAEQGVSLIVTCDTGSTSLAELEIAQCLGLDVIVTDHHTLPDLRPPVVAMLNPRQFPPDHPLATLSGVAVAYKLVEGLYATTTEQGLPPLHPLLELVAIGLVADLVELRGDSRYLVQQGLRHLQHSGDLASRRPGVAELLTLCKRSGDRPGDIAFGIGPRLNAISRISGDAHMAVELLTSRDPERCHRLAASVNQLNQKRRSLQADLREQIQKPINSLDLSTTPVIVLADYGWPIGLLGLVAAQVAQEYSRPTVLLSLEETASDADPPLARGSARSIQGLDLYRLLASQRYLLTSLGGHPFAAGLSLPVTQLELFREGLTAECRRLAADSLSMTPSLAIDAEVNLAELTVQTCREILTLLEPCGMGNPSPKLLLRNLRLEAVGKIVQEGGRRRFPVTQLRLWQGEHHQPGIWWGHWPTDLPQEPCDVVVELDWQPAAGARLRLVELRPTAQTPASQVAPRFLDWRQAHPCSEPDPTTVRVIDQPPMGWEALQHQAIPVLSASEAQRMDQPAIALAYAPWQPASATAATIWSQWLGLLRTLLNQRLHFSLNQLQARLAIEAPLLTSLLNQLPDLGCSLLPVEADQWTLLGPEIPLSEADLQTAWQHWQGIWQEYAFRRAYFDHVPLQVVARELSS